MIDAAVVIPTYNRAEILRIVLSSLARQTYPKDRFEVVVVDDGSWDHTPEVVEQFRDRLDIRYFYQEDEGYRLSRARNIGIENARGDIVILLDSDMVVCPEYVFEHVRTHRGWDGPVVVMGYIYGYGMDGKEVLELVDWNDISKSAQILRQYPKFWDVREFAFRKVGDDLSLFPAPWRFFWGGAASVGRKELLEVGMFDEDFRSWGVEDTEFGYRCFKKGLRFVLNRNAWSVHYPHPGNIRAKKESRKKNILLFYRKHPNLEVELYTVAPRFKYNDLLGYILGLSGMDLIPDYSCPGFGKVLGPLKEGKLLVLGCGMGDMAARLGAEVAADLDKTKVGLAQRRFPHIEFRWALGVRWLYPERWFRKVVVTDFWRALGKIYLGKLLKESLRVGDEVFVLYTPELTPFLSDGYMWHSDDVLRKVCARFGLSCKLEAEDKYCLAYRISTR